MKFKYHNKIEDKVNMSELLKLIKKDLKTAMKVEMTMRQIKDINNLESMIFDFAVAQKEVIRAIISMFPEIGIKPEKATDIDIISLLKKYIFVEKTRVLYEQKHLNEKDINGLTPKELNNLYKQKIKELGNDLISTKIVFAESYLPKEEPKATEDEIKNWISENIDFTKLKNKMQAMGIIMKHFGDRVEGADVKNILIGNF